jgi:hypothetical protein
MTLLASGKGERCPSERGKNKGRRPAFREFASPS